MDLFDNAEPVGDRGWSRPRVPFPSFPTEADFTRHVLARLDPHFHIRTEVSGKHWTGKRFRLDALVYPRDEMAWKAGPGTAFGIEFKKPGSWDLKYRSKWIAQMIEYSQAEWSGAGLVPILACPPVECHNEVAHLMGQFLIGEVDDLRHYGLSLMMHRHHRLWSEHGGVAEGRTWKLAPRSGAR